MLDKRSEFGARREILDLLSDQETALVATSETRQLPAGDEYIDLEHLERGVLISQGPATSTRHVLPRGAVREATWNKIRAVLLESPLSQPAP